MTSKTVIKVGMASCGIAAGARPVYETLRDAAESHEDVEIREVGCIGLCFHEPLVEIEQNGQRTLYGEVSAEKALEIFEKHVIGKTPLAENVVLSTEVDAEENSMISKQVRIVLENCGKIDPTSIDEYIQAKGYTGLEKALKKMDPETVIEEILESGLRGRG